MKASSSLAKLRKSGSGGQGSEFDVFAQEINRKVQLPGLWRESGNLDAEARTLKLISLVE